MIPVEEPASVDEIRAGIQKRMLYLLIVGGSPLLFLAVGEEVLGWSVIDTAGENKQRHRTSNDGIQESFTTLRMTTEYKQQQKG